MSNYFDWADRSTRKREVVRDEIEPVFEPLPVEAPIEVEEDVLSHTGVMRFLQRIAGRRR